ncbi:MAG: hypothetical protein HYZ29_33755 [Myxococcales bacterium]|nr:hypothetical protein [Myxococcales bacterium]
MPPLTPQDDDQLEELPPLDPSPDEEREGPDDDELTPLVSPLEEDVDLEEDSMEPDVDLGLEVHEQSADADDGHEVVLDIGNLLSLADEGTGEEDADRAGPEALDPAADLAELGEPIVGSLEEGTDEPLEDLVSEDLPELDADEPGDTLDEASWVATDALRDEVLPRRAERSWKVGHDPRAGVDLEALALGPDRLWVAGRSLLSLARDGGDCREALATRVLRLETLGDDVLAVTVAGALERVSSTGASRSIAAAHSALDLSPASSSALAVAAFAPGGADAFLVAAGSHRVAVTQSGGASFDATEVGGRVAQVGLGHPTRLLVQGTEGWALLEWGAAGLERTSLDPVAEEVAAGEHVLLGSLGDVVVLTAADRGLCLSLDRGRSFARVPGCLHGCALALGVRDGRPRAFLAAFVESEERSLLIEVDLGTGAAEIVAELEPNDDVAAGDDEDDRARALVWDAEARTLWAASPSGLWRLTPPEWTA